MAYQRARLSSPCSARISILSPSLGACFTKARSLADSDASTARIISSSRCSWYFFAARASTVMSAPALGRGILTLTALDRVGMFWWAGIALGTAASRVIQPHQRKYAGATITLAGDDKRCAHGTCHIAYADPQKQVSSASSLSLSPRLCITALSSTQHDLRF